MESKATFFLCIVCTASFTTCFKILELQNKMWLWLLLFTAGYCWWYGFLGVGGCWLVFLCSQDTNKNVCTSNYRDLVIFITMFSCAATFQGKTSELPSWTYRTIWNWVQLFMFTVGCCCWYAWPVCFMLVCILMGPSLKTKRSNVCISNSVWL